MEVKFVAGKFQAGKRAGSGRISFRKSGFIKVGSLGGKEKLVQGWGINSGKVRAKGDVVQLKPRTPRTRHLQEAIPPSSSKEAEK